MSAVPEAAPTDPFRTAFLKVAIFSFPVLVLHAVLLVWAGATVWALLPVAAILLVCTAYAMTVLANGSRPIATVALPVLFAFSYCVVMAAGLGRNFGFHMLLIVLLPLVLGWERAGSVGRWGMVATIGIAILWVESGGGGAFIGHGPAIAELAHFFSIANLLAAVLLSAAFISIVLDFRNGEMRSLPAYSAFGLRTGQQERRRQTDAANRPYLHFADPERIFSVICVQIDHPAALAEIFGHEVAEAVARQVSALIVGRVRETDMISRRSGQTFLIFLPETVEEEAHAVAERIRLSVSSQPVTANGFSLNVSVTLGVAQSASNMDVAEAITEAERAASIGQAAGHDRTMLAGLL